MKNIAITSSNHRFNKVQEELKSLLSIIMGVVEDSAQEEEQDFEYFSQNATSQEEIKQIEELKHSIQKLNKNAEIYQEGVGIATRKMQSRVSKRTTTEPTTFNEIKPITPRPIENIRHIDDFRDER